MNKIFFTVLIIVALALVGTHFSLGTLESNNETNQTNFTNETEEKFVYRNVTINETPALFKDGRVLSYGKTDLKPQTLKDNGLKILYCNSTKDEEMINNYGETWNKLNRSTLIQKC